MARGLRHSGSRFSERSSKGKRMDANVNGGSSGGGSVGTGRRGDDVAMGGPAKGAAAQGKASAGQRRPRGQASGGAGANPG